MAMHARPIAIAAHRSLHGATTITALNELNYANANLSLLNSDPTIQRFVCMIVAVVVPVAVDSARPELHDHRESSLGPFRKFSKKLARCGYGSFRYSFSRHFLVLLLLGLRGKIILYDPGRIGWWLDQLKHLTRGKPNRKAISPR
jgi:hypothetical protein